MTNGFPVRKRKSVSPDSRRISVFYVYFNSPDVRGVSGILRDAMKSIAIEETKSVTESVWLSTGDKRTCISVSDGFIQVRSNLNERDELSGQMEAIAAGILGQKEIRQTGLIIRLISLMNVSGECDDVPTRLNAKYLGFLGGVPQMLDCLIDGSSMKFYFLDGEVPCELDVGPYIGDPSWVYVELESRRVGVHSGKDFSGAWGRDLKLLDRVQMEFVRRTLLWRP